MKRFADDIEILRYAISREVISHELYLALAKRTSRPSQRQLFTVLAEEERQHKAKLELELMKMGQVVDDAEMTASLEDTAIIPALREDAPDDFRTVIMTAIERERGAFRIFVNLAMQITSDPQRELLLSLAEEEARHRVLLQLEYDALEPRAH